MHGGGAGGGGGATAQAALAALQQLGASASGASARQHVPVAAGTATAAASWLGSPEAEEECWSCDEDSADEDVDGAPLYNSDGTADSDAEFAGKRNETEALDLTAPRTRSRRHDGTLSLRARARVAMRLQLGGGQTRLVHALRARGDG